MSKHGSAWAELEAPGSSAIEGSLNVMPSDSAPTTSAADNAPTTDAPTTDALTTDAPD